MKSLRGGPFFAFSLPVGQRAPLPPRQLRHCPQSKSAAPQATGSSKVKPFRAELFHNSASSGWS